MMFFFFLKDVLSGKNIVVHARGLQGAAVLLPLKKILRKLKIICDVRGLEADEYDYSVRRGEKQTLNYFQRLWKRHLDKVAAYSIEKSDRVFFVSQSMMEHTARAMPATRKINWRYVPCSVETHKFEAALATRDVLRRKMGMTGRIVVTYVGGNRTWQGIDQTAFLFARMKELNPKLMFLGLTREQDTLKQAFAAHGIIGSDLCVEHASYDQIQDYMVCADIGLLIRANLPLNNYACPTKFAEYLASGLHVVTTPAVFDMAQIVQNEGVGTVLHDISQYEVLRIELTEAIEKAEACDRIEKSVRTAKKWLDWSVHLPKIKDTYRELQ